MMTQNSDAFKNNFHYLAVPLYLKIGRLKDDQRVAFTSFIGMEMHYLFKASHISLDGNETDRPDYAQKFHADMAGGPNFKFLMSANNVYLDEKNDISNYTTGFHLDYTMGFGLKYRLHESLVLESHVTGSFLGGSFNNGSFDGFLLRNTNYGAVFGFKYHLTDL